MGKIVITTIQAPTPSVTKMIEMGRQQSVGTIIVGDNKTPNLVWPDEVTFLSIDKQREMNIDLANLLPENHYARKNVGYLTAISQGAGFIFDTDDDNAPLDNWQKRELRTQARACTHAGWINVYRCFTDEHIWPRGLPLEYILNNDSIELQKNTVAVNSPIQQGLANGSPDVDAVWRLTLDKNIAFEANSSILLKEGAWCPFNSQSTWWFPQAFPLLYLPSYVSFRMTDIWRSFVAQRCLWAMKHGLVFHGPEMFQERNPHNLIRDFEQEIPGYVGNTKICKILEKQNLTSGLEQVGDNLHRCYESLVSAGFIPPQEMKLVEAWLLDLSITMNAKSN